MMRMGHSGKSGGRIWKRLVMVLELALLVGSVQMMDAGTPAAGIEDLGRPLVIGHRGYPAIAPENTLKSFDLAKLAGADLVELDYHVSADGEAIVIHDSKLDRTTDAVSAWGREGVEVGDKTASELKTLDAGSWFDGAYRGISLPTLVEALEVIQADGGITLIERKAGSPEHLVGLLREKGLVNEVIVQSFDWDFLQTFHEMEAEQVIWALGPQKTWEGRKLSKGERNLSPEWIDRASQTGAGCIVWNKAIDRESLDYAHQNGLKVIVYTVNDLETAQSLLRLGVDGIISNNVSVIWKALALLDASSG